MRKTLFQVFAIAVAIAVTQCAKADSFTFVIDGMDFQSDLTFTASQIAGQPAGVDLITGVTGWFTNPDTGHVNLATNPATVVSTGVTPPGSVTQYGFLYDNVLYSKAGSAGILDWNGLLIEINGSYYLNLFSDGTEFYFADNGAYYGNYPIQTPSGGPALASGGPALAPEPSSLVLLGSASLILAFAVGWKARHARADSSIRPTAV
ncbi:MAG: hypothetical protein ACRD3S_19395 [Terracidiphilus sp.]